MTNHTNRFERSRREPGPVVRRRPWPQSATSMPQRVPALPSAPLARSGGGVMGRLGRFVVRHRRAVILSWLVLLIVTATIGSSAFSVLSTDFGAGTSTESGRVAQQLDDLAETGGQIAIVADDIDVDDPQVRRDHHRRAGADRRPRRRPRRRRSLVHRGRALRATDGRAALVVVTLTGDLTEDDELALAQHIEDVAHQLDAPEVLVGGNVLVSETFATASENDLLKGEAIALPIAILAMVVLLGGLVAGGMPMLVALGGVITTLAVLVGATVFGDVSIFSVNVVNMLGIGLGIDYGLLMVNRFREERGHGLDVHDAVVATVASAGTTVVFSALTVAVAMSGLFVFGVPLLTSFGIAGLSVVLLCMAAAVTLLPATLAAVGGRIKPSRPVPDTEGRFYRLARWVQQRPLKVGGAAALLLVLLGMPFLSAVFENGDARTLPRSSEVRATALTLSERFPARGTDPVTVIAGTDADDPAFAAWLADISAADGVVGASTRPGTPPGSPSSTWSPPAPRRARRPPRWSNGSAPSRRRSKPRSADRPPSSSTSRPSSAPGSPSPPPWSCWPPSSCCS